MAWLIVWLLNATCQAALISEFRPNPPGSDPSTTSVEFTGAPGVSFTDWTLFTIDTDNGEKGNIDRLTTFSGTFDASGIFALNVPDFENPSFVIALASSGFSSSRNSELDADNDGVLDAPGTLGVIEDAIGIPDSTGDANNTFASQLGGTDFAFTGSEPQIVFRDSTTDALFAVNDPIGAAGNAFAADGSTVPLASFDFNPVAGSFGSVNATTTTAVPEPSSFLLLGLLAAFLVAKRKIGQSKAT